MTCIVSAAVYVIEIVYDAYRFSFETPAEGPSESRVQWALHERDNAAASLSRPIYTAEQQYKAQLHQAQREFDTKDALLCQTQRELAKLKQAMAIQNGQLLGENPPDEPAIQVPTVDAVTPAVWRHPRGAISTTALASWPGISPFLSPLTGSLARSRESPGPARD
jgi:hypothetical protein